MLNITPEAGAYGLFQVTFASLDWQLTKALVRLLRTSNPKLAFRMVPKMFGAKLQLLRKALDEWPHDIHNSEELSALRRIASEADALRKWRNQRIHARVEFIEGTSVLLDDTGRQLPITYDECERQIQVTIRLAVELQTYAVSLVKQAESDARLLEIIQRDLRENRAMAEDE